MKSDEAFDGFVQLIKRTYRPEEKLTDESSVLKLVSHVSVRLGNSLKNGLEGKSSKTISTIGELRDTSDTDLKRNPNFGRLSLTELCTVLEKVGLPKRVR